MKGLRHIALWLVSRGGKEVEEGVRENREVGKESRPRPLRRKESGAQGLVIQEQPPNNFARDHICGLPLANKQPNQCVPRLFLCKATHIEKWENQQISPFLFT